MKVYIIIASYGTYERWNFVESVWNNPESAELHKSKMIADNTIKATMPAPCSEEEFYSGLLSEKQEEAYDTWMNDKYYAEEFNEPEIKEFEVKS